MAVGKKDGIRPADIVGSIANEADVPGREIGPIDIREDMTIVVLPAKYRDQVLTKVAGARFRGRPLNIQEADASPPFGRTAARGEARGPRDFGKAVRPRGEHRYERPASNRPGARSSAPFTRRDGPKKGGPPKGSSFKKRPR